MLSTVAIPVAEEGRVKADYKQGLSLQYNQEVILAQHGVKYKRTFPTENHVATGGKDEEPPESLKLGGGGARAMFSGMSLLHPVFKTTFLLAASSQSDVCRRLLSVQVG